MQIKAHEWAYWLRVAVRYVWVLARWFVQLVRLCLFRSDGYRNYRAFMEGQAWE